MKILIVDDEKKNIRLLEDFLTGLGHNVMAAENGKIALEMAIDNPPEIIISDILMPVMDGFKLCQEWKKDSKLKNIPFIFYTATYTSEEDRKFALSLGADRFIVKPTPMKSLIKIVSEVIKDYKGGRYVVPKKPVIDETAILKGHYERLAKKLDNKIAQLKKENNRRKQTEKRLKHLNEVLRTTRKVNQLIIMEKDRDRLLESVCNSFINYRSYYSAWIALFDKNRKLLTVAEAGVGRNFLPITKLLKSGKFTICAQKSLSQSEVFIFKNTKSTCTDCPISDCYGDNGAMTVRLEHDGKVYGMMCVSASRDFVIEEEDQSLFKEVTDDIAFALYNMELEEKRKQVEDLLEKERNLLRTLIDNLPDIIYVKDTESRFVTGN